MLGLLPPVSGQIRHPLGRRPRFGYLPQRFVFEPTFAMTTLDMVVMGRYPRIGLGRRVGAADRQAARELLAQVGLEAFTDAPVQSLSGGQRQRALDRPGARSPIPRSWCWTSRPTASTWWPSGPS